MTIVYQGTLEQFYAESAEIPERLAQADLNPAVRNTAQYRAWTNSLPHMHIMLSQAGVPESCGVLIEYRLPTSSRRVDFIITGHDKEGSANFVIIELKQWSSAQAIESKPGVVIANVAGTRNEETSHPCYQAWSYKIFLENMLDAVEKHRLRAHACAYMHNYDYKGISHDPLAAAPNEELVQNTPLFGLHDRKSLGAFVLEYVQRGDGAEIMEQLANGKVVPSTRLADAVAAMFDEASPKAFTLIDEQKIAYETIMSAVRCAPLNSKHCVIITGGPGTGKSVVSISAFASILKEFRNDERRRNIRFVSPTTSFRETMVSMLSGQTQDSKETKRRKSFAKNLFCGSMSFFESDINQSKKNVFPRNRFHCLLCDEAHRLHSHQNMYRGQNQIEDIVNAACVSVFFVDDNQALRPYDIGSVESIRKAAKKYRADITQIDLAAQFRCQGSAGFLNWLAVVLGLADEQSVGNAQGWDKANFDFDIVDTPQAVVDFVDEKNRACSGNSKIAGRSVISGARLLAGYAWPWTKDNNKHEEVPDVDLGTLKLPWNNRSSSYLWAIDPDTKLRHEVGCVHTSQGLEFDWVGVFIGNDLHYDPTEKKLYADIDNYYDKGGKNGLGKGKAERQKNLLPYVCRCYRVLLSRGVRGARVYCCDKHLSAYLKEKLAQSQNFAALD